MTETFATIIEGSQDNVEAPRGEMRERTIKQIVIYVCIPVAVGAAAFLPYEMGREGVLWAAILIVALILGFTNVFEKLIARARRLRGR